MGPVAALLCPPLGARWAVADRSSSNQHGLTHVSDLADPHAVGKLFASVDTSLPRLDIFVVNAVPGAWDTPRRSLAWSYQPARDRDDGRPG